MVAPGQTPGQDDAPADASRARPDKTQGAQGQMSDQGAGAAVGERQPSATGRGSRKTGAKRTVSRPKAAGKRTTTKRKAGASGAAKGPAAKKAKRPTGQKTGSGRKNATAKTRKGGARKTTSKKPTKTRAGSGKAGGKRNR